MNEASEWKVRTIVLGTVIGALTGLGAAFLLVQRAEQAGSRPKMGSGEGIKLALALLGLLRLVDEFREPEEELRLTD
jgi:hypothetical protein